MLLALLAAGMIYAGAKALARGSKPDMTKAVVKIEAQVRPPDQFNPWQSKDQEKVIGSGVILGGGRILTNAHIVTDGVYIEVMKAHDPEKYTAKVEIIGHQCDLALLKVEDPAFFEGTAALELAGLPELLDEVSVFGFPEGGESLSITRGVVSRVEVMTYIHGMVDLLGVQIDAAINPGNSGGPAVKEGKIIGIAMQTLAGGDNIGYIIPTPVIEHFLADARDGRYGGFPGDGLALQQMQNEDLREHYGLKKGDGGALVVAVAYQSSSWGALMPGDVIVAIDGQKVDRDGSVALDGRFRVGAKYMSQRKFVGEKITFEVLRAGTRRTVEVTLKNPVNMVPVKMTQKPDYLIFGGYVFLPLTMNYLWEWGANWERDAPANLVALAENSIPTPEKREVVFMRSALAHKTNAGYQDLFNWVVTEVDGQKIADMDEFAAAIRQAKGTALTLTSSNGEKLVINRGKAEAAEAEILESNGIPAAASQRFSAGD